MRERGSSANLQRILHAGSGMRVNPVLAGEPERQPWLSSCGGQANVSSDVITGPWAAAEAATGVCAGDPR